MQKPPKTTTKTTFLFEGNETRRVGGTNTGSTVLDRLAVGVVSHLCAKKRVIQRRKSPKERLRQWEKRTMR
jgi:hypothetical protein